MSTDLSSAIVHLTTGQKLICEVSYGVEAIPGFVKLEIIGLADDADTTILVNLNNIFAVVPISSARAKQLGPSNVPRELLPIHKPAREPMRVAY